MSYRWLARTATAIGAAAIVAFMGASPAWATSQDLEDVPLNQTNVTADEAEQNCEDEKFDGQEPGQDAWLFVLPDEAWDFTEVRLNFDDAGNPVPVVINDVEPGSDSGPGWTGFLTISPGTSKAILFTEAGWTLLNGEADITGPDDDQSPPAQFQLSHACAGEETTPPTTPPRTTPPGTTEPPDLPKTGVALGGLITVAAGLVIGGTLLLIARRRRDGATDSGAAGS